MKRLFFAFLSLSFIAGTALAQESVPVPRNIQSAYEAGTRSPEGQPGPNYWQNTANYDIQVRFVPESRLLSGTEKITYINNSPDTLQHLWIKLYPNYYQKGAPRDGSIDPEDASEGVQIESFADNGKALSAKDWEIDATNMTVDIKPLLPGEHREFAVKWHYTLNKGSHNRMGEVEPGSYFVAYFFPRITVYDDIDGWNRYPYTGSQEFYNDFCHFKASISVPQNYVVWATGDLKNADDVLQPTFVKRIAEAEKSDAVTDIITKKEAAGKKVTQANAVNTWQFEADHVTDFVFATSDHYVWKASSLVVDPKTKRRTRVDAVFNPKHKDYEEAVDFARKTVEAMSYTFPKWPYPYPHETVF